MPVATPIVGKNAVVKFTPTGGTELIIKNSKWMLNLVANVRDAFNTSDGVLRLAGLPDANGTVEGFIDTSALINAGVNEGAIGVLKLYTDATHFFSLTAIIGDISIDSAGVNDVAKWNFAFSLQSGTVTEPV